MDKELKEKALAIKKERKETNFYSQTKKRGYNARVYNLKRKIDTAIDATDNWSNDLLVASMAIEMVITYL